MIELSKIREIKLIGNEKQLSFKDIINTTFIFC